MSERLDSINYLNVCGAIRESLCLDPKNPDHQFGLSTYLVNLGADRADVADIFYRIGVSLVPYVSGDYLKQKGVKLLQDIESTCLGNPKLKKRARHFERLSRSRDTNELINNLRVYDLIRIGGFLRTKK